MAIKFNAIRSVLSQSMTALSLAAISCFGLISEAVGTPIKMEYTTLVGHIDSFTYTDGLGTATTGPITLTLNGPGSSFGFEDLTLGTFTDHLVMTTTFDDGRGHALTGAITIDAGGPLITPEIATITSGVLAGASAFDGANFFGRMERKHGKDCSEGGWCWTFLVPPNPGISIHLPASFLDPIDIPLSGAIDVTMVPEPATLLMLASGIIIMMLYQWLDRRARQRLI